MAAYYNEIDPQAAQWLRNLIAAGHIAPGEVDNRSILEVRPDELAPFTQCHFFAGIGVWSYALRSAGWSDDRPVWTGSCPCQPFSAAGKGDEFADERHLWPAWFRLIRERRPRVVFGEQVASQDAEPWLDHVCADMEAEGYAIGPVDTCAAGFGAPHLRQRFFFVADAQGMQLPGRPQPGLHLAEVRAAGADEAASPGRSGSTRGTLGHTDEPVAGEERLQRGGQLGRAAEDAGPGPTAGFWRAADWLPCRDGKTRPVEPGSFPLVDGAPGRLVRLRAYGNAIVAPVAVEFIRAYLDVMA